MSIEEEVIAEKLKQYGNMDASNESAYHSGIRDNLYALKNNAVNTSIRYMKMEAGIRGKLNWLKKKVVRRLCFFYVQPICDQQTQYNTAAVQCIEQLASAETNLHDQISELERSNDELRQELQKELAGVYKKLDQYMENMEMIEKSGICKLPSLVNDSSIKSYAQSGEDAIVLYIFSNLQVNLQKATYLDLGANHAKALSNTYALYEKGMRGVLLEANPALIPELKLSRSEDIIVHKCLTQKSGQSVTFYVLSGDGLSTADRKAAEKIVAENPQITIVEEVEVETVTIQELFDQYFAESPTLLNIDLEGMEWDILTQMDFTKIRPLVIIVEMIDYSAMINAGSKNGQILRLMKENNYIEYAFTGINSIFVDASVW